MNAPARRPFEAVWSDFSGTRRSSGRITTQVFQMSISTPPAVSRLATRTVARLDAALVAADRRAWLLWGSVLLALALDSVLTWYGLQRGLTEGNPLVRSLVEAYGAPVALATTKAAVVAVGLLAWRTLPAGPRAVVPIGLSIPWWAAVCVNVVMLSTL